MRCRAQRGAGLIFAAIEQRQVEPLIEERRCRPTGPLNQGEGGLHRPEPAQRGEACREKARAVASIGRSVRLCKKERVIQGLDGGQWYVRKISDSLQNCVGRAVLPERGGQSRGRAW